MYLPEADWGMPETRPLVMVVHDDEAIRDALDFALGLEGVDVCRHEAGGALLADPALPQAACLVLRHHLPGMDGLEILARVRARGLTMPAVLLTSHATPDVQARARAAGVWLLLEKPIMDDALVSAIAKLLRETT